MSVARWNQAAQIVWTPAAAITAGVAWAGTAIPTGTVYALIRAKTTDVFLVPSNVDATGGGADPAADGISIPVNCPIQLLVVGNTFLNHKRDGGVDATITVMWGRPA